MRKVFSFRITLISILACLIALLLMGRLYMLQVVEAETFRAVAKGQYVEQNASLFDRGSIFFKDKVGNLVSAATLRSGFTVAVNPKLLTNPDTVFTKISPLLPDLSKEDFLTKATKKNDPYEELLHRVPEETGDAITDFDITGLNSYRERWRYYPGNSMAAHTVGFLAYEGDQLAGRYGLERSYNDTLSRASASLYVNFFAEVFANLNKTLFLSDEAREGDVVTAIEPSVQLYLENKLRDVNAKWSPKSAGGIIINPKTGEIYALAALPTFDLNDFEDSDLNSFKNPLVENVYEFGSIMKPLTMAAGLDVGVVTPETTYNDKGSIVLDGKKISNYDGKGRGVVPMQEVLSQSLNTGVTFVVQQMGTDTFRSYMEKYGIREETGIDLPNEAMPLTSNLDSPRTLEYATASFGQGIALTPVGMARALSTLAGGGVVPQPHVVTDIQYSNGLTKHIAWTPGPQAIKPETAEEISRMLVTVVDTALLHGNAKQEHYSIAAKTGTAQIANPDGGGYYTDRYLHSFFGYFPAYDAKFLVFLYVVEPQHVQYASETLTEPFLDISKFLISYYELPPDR